MKKLLRKLAGIGTLVAVLSVTFAPAAMAQSVLDDIKGKLAEENIAVIDYSTPEGAWGTLPSEWVEFLSPNFNSLNDLAMKHFDAYFLANPNNPEAKRLIPRRRQLAIAVAEKSRLTTSAEINEKNDEIESLEEDVEDLENDIRDTIAGLIEDAPDNLNNIEGINLLFAEIDFHYNYNKWGRLPIRVIGKLEGYTDYINLQDLIDLNEGLANDAAVEGLQAELRSYTDGDTGPRIFSESDIELIIESTVILLSSGEAQLSQVGRTVADTIKNLVGALAVIWIVIAGARMIFAQGDENVITEQKRAITYGIIGLVAILMVDRMIDVIYGPTGVVRTELVADPDFDMEIYGIVNFIKAVIGTIAILLIVISGVRMVFASGEEEQITKQKKAVLYIGLGLILIAIDEVIVEQFFIRPTRLQSDQLHSTNVASIIDTMGTVLQFLLGFVGLIAFGALIYGGATMIMNYGNDEMVEKSKKIIRNAIIGILVILSAYTIVASLVVFQ